MITIDPDILNYSIANSSKMSKECDAIEAYTKQNVPRAGMLSGPLEGALLQLLIHLHRPKLILEIGTFTGYSALVMAEALPEGGKLITLDINPETSAMARSFWDQSPHGKKIEARVGAAAKLLSELNARPDLVFIDADKENYPYYFEQCEKILNPGGLLIFDNALWSGKVLSPEAGDCDTQGIVKVTEMIQSNPRWRKLLLPIRDGVLIASPDASVGQGVLF